MSDTEFKEWLKGDKMNNIDEMPSVCHDCPYWGVCVPPYVCPIKSIKDD